jgi:ribonucleoside-diphosphate reductase alpha chain
VNYWAAPDGDRLGDAYQSAWDIPAKDMTELYAIVQKWTDQGISADFYRKVIGDASIESTELIADYLYRVKLGLKSKYYMNQKTSNGMREVAHLATAEPQPADDMADADSECDACTL